MAPSDSRHLNGAQSRTSEETQRSLRLDDGTLIHYRLRRTARKTIGLTVDRSGLRIGAPMRASMKSIESAIAAHAAWVLRKTAELTARSHDLPILEIIDGSRIPVLGRPLSLTVHQGTRNAFVCDEAAAHIALRVRPPATAGGILERGLRQYAKTAFKNRLDHFAGLMGLSAPELSLSSARTRWGSCSTRSGIRLNWRLVHFSLPIIDYVVVHELAHLLEMNHSHRFWAIVARYCPSHKALRADLKRLAPYCPRWS